MKRLFLAATATGLLMAMNASATLVADFDPSGAYVGARARDVDTDTGATWNYSDSNLLLNDVNGQSGKIYGGVTTAWTVPQTFPELYVLKNPNDGFVVQVSPPDNTGTQSITGAYLWSKADFLDGVSDIVQLNSGNSISFNFDWMTAAGDQQIRLIVKQSGVTYISEWWTAGFAGISHDPSTTNWAVFDTTNYTWGAFSPLTLDDIEGAGLYYTLSTTGETAAARLNDFQIDATVVPAPGTDELVVDYSPSAVDTDGRVPDINTQNGDTWNFSTTIPLFNDTDVTGGNGRIYGGIATTWSNAADYTPGLYHAVAEEGFTVQVIPPNVIGTQSLKAVYLWDKADFLAGASDIIQFNAGSNVSYNFSWVTAQTVQFRLVVKQGGVVYISEWNTTDYGDGGPNITKTFTSTNWAVLNTTDYTWGTFSPATFDDVEGVGIYSQVSCINEQAAARLIDFQVTARVIPDEGGDFASWAIANNIAGEPFDGDSNNDGISNGVAYALGLSPTLSSQPAGVLSGNTITFTKGADAIANADVAWIIETSETLSGSWLEEVTQPAGDATATISYDLTPVPGTPKKFARLKVVKTP